MAAAVRRARLLASVALLCVVPLSHGAGVNWTGGSASSDNWTDSTNWSLFDRPNDGDTVYMEGTPARTSPNVNQNYSINYLIFDPLQGFGTRSSFTINGSSTLSIADAVWNRTDKTQTVNVQLKFTSSGQISNDNNNGNYGYMSVKKVDTNGKTVTLEPSTSGLAMTDTISGTGKILVAGQGTTTLSGTNTFSGGIELQRGTLTYSTGPNLGAVSNLITFNASNGNTPTLRRTASGTTAGNVWFAAGEGRIAVPSGVTVTHSGFFTGAGDFAKTEGGTLILTNATDRTGSTYVREGTLRVSAGGDIADHLLDVSAGATVQYDDGILDRVGALGGGGTILLGIDGELAVGNTNSTDGGGTFSGTISGLDVGFVKYGSATLNLTGNNAWSGQTNVVQGTLLVNNASAVSSATGTSSVVVSNGASFGGDGRIAGSVRLDSGARLGPNPSALTDGISVSIGSLTVGSLDARAGSIYLADLSSGGGNDTLTVEGNATLAGKISLATTLNLPINTTAQREIIHVNGTLSGHFSTVSGVQMSNGKWLAVSYGVHSVYVTPAIAGDANLNGAVNFADLVALAQNYNQTNRVWTSGDFNGDGTTNFADLVTLAQHYNTGTSSLLAAGLPADFAADWALAQSFVPEPTAGFGLLAVAAIVRRRR